MCHDNSFLLHATQNGIQLYVLTFYDGFWPLLFIENSRHYIYLQMQSVNSVIANASKHFFEILLY